MFGLVVQNKCSFYFSTLQPCKDHSENIGQLYDGPVSQRLQISWLPLPQNSTPTIHQTIVPNQPTTPRFPHATATFTHFVDTFLAHPFPQINFV